jgi:signal transduction histidine kinase
MHFDPANIQEVGIGIAALLSTVVGTFIFFGARHDKVGRAMAYTLASIAFWSWFGFLYHVTGSLPLARQFRVLSVIGIVWLSIFVVHFSAMYYAEKGTLVRWMRIGSDLIRLAGIWFSLLLFLDLFHYRNVVGNLLLPTNTVLAPDAGPWMGPLIVFYCAAMLLSMVFFSIRIRLESGLLRRQSQILGASVILGLALGATRFTPWYGFDFQPFLGALAFPLFTFTAFYSVRKFHLLNLQIAVAQILIFVIWTFTFTRMLLDPTLSAAIPDIALFLAVLILGVFLIRSIIVERRAQQELAKLTVDKEKSEFVTIAAHQLRTPMAALRWSFNLLAQGDMGPLTDMQKSIVDKGNRAAEHMVDIVNDLLDLSKMADGKFRYELKDGDVGATVRSESQLFEEIAKEKGITLRVSADEGIPQIQYDAGKLALAIQNLVDNALKYTARGGSVDVRVSAESGRVRITVTDTGIGMSADERSRLFERFFRGTRAIRMSPDGSGLGLFIAKTVVEGHGGTLRVTSEENKGTTVEISLPARQTKA